MSTYQELAKNIQEHIEPFKPCACGEKVLVTVAVEPIKAEYFRDDSVQHCIVQCRSCGKMYISEY